MNTYYKIKDIIAELDELDPDRTPAWMYAPFLMGIVLVMGLGCAMVGG